MKAREISYEEALTLEKVVAKIEKLKLKEEGILSDEFEKIKL